MRARAAVVSATLVLAASTLPLSATTILLGSDGELADRADARSVRRMRPTRRPPTIASR